jgi:hypothetical protein
MYKRLLVCELCGVDYWAGNALSKKCSTCRGKENKTDLEEEHRCPVCGKLFLIPSTRRVSKKKYCSDECRHVVGRIRSAAFSENNKYAGCYSKIRFLVLLRDKFQCKYCGRSPYVHGAVLHVDHVLPRDKGGKDEVENLITSCFDCNLGKGSIDYSGKIKLHFGESEAGVNYEITY